MGKDRLFLGYKTAYRIWRIAGPIAFSTLTQSRVRSLMGGAPSRAKIAAFLSEHPDLATDPLDVIVKSGDQRKMPRIKTHVRSKELPDRLFYKLDDDVYVASPELCLAQLSTKLSEPEIVKLAYEMCGSYAIDPFADP